MEGLQSYILSVTAAGILCAVIGCLAGKGSQGATVKLMCGVVMTAVIIKPVLSAGPVNLSRYLNQLDLDASAAVTSGLQLSGDAARARISEELEAYILDKAGELGLQISVELTLDNRSGIPDSVAISGAASPHARSAMTEMLRDELGIPTEAQIWK